MRCNYNRTQRKPSSLNEYKKTRNNKNYYTHIIFFIASKKSNKERRNELKGKRI